MEVKRVWVIWHYVTIDIQDIVQRLGHSFHLLFWVRVMRPGRSLSSESEKETQNCFALILFGIKGGEIENVGFQGSVITAYINQINFFLRFLLPSLLCPWKTDRRTDFGFTQMHFFLTIQEKDLEVIMNRSMNMSTLYMVIMKKSSCHARDYWERDWK